MLPLWKAETTHRSYATHQFCKQFQLLTALHTDEVRDAVEHWRGENVIPLHRVHAHSESEVKLAEQVTVVPQSFSLHFVKAVCICSTVTCQTLRILSNWILWIEFTGYSNQKNILPALLSTITLRPCLSSCYGTRAVLDTVVKMPDKNTSRDFLGAYKKRACNTTSQNSHNFTTTTFPPLSDFISKVHVIVQL